MTLPLNNPLPMPAPGTVIQLPASAVYQSADPLRLRVKEVAYGKPIHPSAEWVTISGEALNDDDTVRGVRSALVSVKVLAELAGIEPASITVTRRGEAVWSLHGLTEWQLSGDACLNCGGRFDDVDTWEIGWHEDARVYVHLECVDMFRAKAIART